MYCIWGDEKAQRLPMLNLVNKQINQYLFIGELLYRRRNNRVSTRIYVSLVSGVFLQQETSFVTLGMLFVISQVPYYIGKYSICVHKECHNRVGLYSTVVTKLTLWSCYWECCCSVHCSWDTFMALMIWCEQAKGAKVFIKGSLTRDFRHQFFFLNQCPPGPWVSH